MTKKNYIPVFWWSSVKFENRQQENFGDILSKYLVEKRFNVGIVPHYIDYPKGHDWYKDDKSLKVIDLLNNDIEAVIDEILSCKQILSSSLHGLIVSNAYNIPSVWVEFSNKLSGDGVKFVDYFKSVDIDPYQPSKYSEKLSSNQVEELFNKYQSLPKKDIINTLSDKLLSVCPFKA